MKAEETVKPTDLRFDNWVNVKNGTLTVSVKVHSIYPSAIGTRVGTIMYGNVSPVPLSPEILEKAGFGKVNHIHGYTFHSHEKSKICVYEHKTEYRGQSVCHVHFVHQLQNLYFALTGSELSLDL